MFEELEGVQLLGFRFHLLLCFFVLFGVGGVCAENPLRRWATALPQAKEPLNLAPSPLASERGSSARFPGKAVSGNRGRAKETAQNLDLARLISACSRSR